MASAPFQLADFTAKNTPAILRSGVGTYSLRADRKQGGRKDLLDL